MLDDSLEQCGASDRFFWVSLATYAAGRCGPHGVYNSMIPTTANLRNQSLSHSTAPAPLHRYVANNCSPRTCLESSHSSRWFANETYSPAPHSKLTGHHCHRRALRSCHRHCRLWYTCRAW